MKFVITIRKKMWSVLKNTKLSLYDFPIAAVTLSGLKQCKFILLHFWRPQVQNRSHVVKIKGQQHHVSFGGSRGHFASCLFQLLQAAYLP